MELSSQGDGDRSMEGGDGAGLVTLGPDRVRGCIEMHKGLLEDTLIVDQPVALAHIDVDWYDPVRVSLERIWPMLASGGVIVLDDYFDWSGARRAADEFFATRADEIRFDAVGGALAAMKVPLSEKLVKCPTKRPFAK